MRYDGVYEWIPLKYTDPMRLCMSATLSSVTRAWNNYYLTISRERSMEATTAAIYEKNDLGINEIACILIYDRALSRDEMTYNFMIHQREFGE